MEKYFQALGIVLIAVILILSLQKQGKETALVLSVLVCCLGAYVALSFLQPVLDFIDRLQAVADIDTMLFSSLLKVAGIAFTSEVASLICTDAGNASLGKVLQILGSCAILWLSLPMLSGLLEMVEGILTKL